MFMVASAICIQIEKSVEWDREKGERETSLLEETSYIKKVVD